MKLLILPVCLACGEGSCVLGRHPQGKPDAQRDFQALKSWGDALAGLVVGFWLGNLQINNGGRDGRLLAFGEQL